MAEGKAAGSPAGGLTIAEAAFTDAFNQCRALLAGFAHCNSRDELRVVRDAFFLRMASHLCTDEYALVKGDIVASAAVAEAAGTGGSFEATVVAARAAAGWGGLVRALMLLASSVDSDLVGIWGTLERGRIEWITAVNATHKLKTGLRARLIVDGGTARDVAEAKMVWVYALGSVLPPCEAEAAAWAAAAGVEDGTNPLLGYNEEKWDARRAEWAPLDRAVQAAASRGGVEDLDAVWAV
jgi:hypothetical protein